MSDEIHLAERLDSIINVVVEARADGKIEPREAFRILGEVISAAAHVLESLDDETHFDTLVTECEKIFDQHIAPLDIAGVPNFLEPYLDQLLRSQIRPLLENLNEYVQ